MIASALLLLGCGASPEPASPVPASVPEPIRRERTTREETRYRYGAAVVVAHGEPCTVERVGVESGERRTMFTVEGACPTHCAFEARMAVCAQGTSVVRHAYGDHSLALVDEPVLADVQRVFIAPDGVPHVLTAADGVVTEREILVTGSRVLREEPLPADGLASLRVDLYGRAFDLDSIQRDCPTGVCYGFGEPHPDALAAYEARHGVAPAHRMFLPDRPLLFQQRDVEVHGPVEVCDDAACTAPVLVETTAPATLVAHPPFLLVVADGRARVVGLDDAPGRDLGPVDWATFVPFDLSL